MRSILAKIIRHPIVRLVLGIVIFMTLNAVTQIVAFSTAGITENYALAIFFTLVLAIFSCFAYAVCASAGASPRYRIGDKGRRAGMGQRLGAWLYFVHTHHWLVVGFGRVSRKWHKPCQRVRPHYLNLNSLQRV